MGCLDKFQRFMCRAFVNRPESMFGLGLTILLGLCFIAAPNMEISEETQYDWTISSSIESQNEDLMNNLLTQVDGHSTTSSNTTSVRSQLNTKTSLTIMYELSSDNTLPVFTPEALQSICTIESTLWNLDLFQTSFCQVTEDPNMQMPESTTNCATPLYSLVPRFYNWPPFGNATTRECTLLSASDIATTQDSLMTDLQTPGAPTAFFIGSNVDLTQPISDQKTVRTRSMIGLGGPLLGYSSLQDRETNQLKTYKEMAIEWENALFNVFEMENTFFKSAYRTKATHGPVTVRFFNQLFQNLEMDRVVNGDLMWTLASITFVYFFLKFHMSSFFLANVGMLQILCSLPIAYFFYRFVFQVPFFTQLHILTIFLVLGIGADDLFVLVDAWRQSEAEVNAETSNSTYIRMLLTYKKAFGAIFNTSFTTAMAFVSTAVSPIMPLSAFGIFAALAILVNFLYVIGFTPTAVLLYYKYLDNRGTCGFGSGKKNTWERISAADAAAVDLSSVIGQKNTATPDLETIGQKQESPPTPSSSLLQRFFSGPYSKFITCKRNAIAVIVIFTALMINGVYFASQLTTPESQEQWFTSDHMWTGIFDEFSTGFLAGPDNEYTPASIVWGTSGLDRSDFNQWFPGDNRGTAIFNSDFSPLTEASATHLLRTCDRLRTTSCTAKGCMDSSGLLVRTGSVKCWIETLLEEYDSSFNLENLRSFRSLHPEYKDDIGFIDSELKYLRIRFVLSLVKQQPFERTNSVNEVLTSDVLVPTNEEAPAEMTDGAFVEAGRWFAWTRTEEGLVGGMFTGFAICFPVAFLVLCFATGNMLLATYASITIAGIVSCVLGTCQALLGWNLGIAESIAAVIVIGFSVDYVCHLAHPYVESTESTRSLKTRDSAVTMGPTVTAGAMTTLGAGLCMFGCQMTFFTKMAVLISLTIGFSLMFSLGFFMALCSVVGPEGSTGMLPWHRKK